MQRVRKVHRSALLTGAKPEQRQLSTSGSILAATGNCFSCFHPCGERGRSKWHLALPSVRMEDKGAAVEAVGGERQHLREQLFINLAPTHIDLIQGLRDQIHLWAGDDYWQVGGGPRTFAPCLQNTPSTDACCSGSPQDLKRPP